MRPATASGRFSHSYLIAAVRLHPRWAGAVAALLLYPTGHPAPAAPAGPPAAALAHCTAGSAADESTTLVLRLSADQESLTREAQVTVGQNARQIIENLKPAPPAADDDPWLAYAAPGEGHYILFFPPSDGARA